MTSDEFSSVLKDATEEGWRQVDSIKKLSTFKNDQSLKTLFQLAFSSKKDPQGILSGGTESYRLSRTRFELKHSSEIRWTAAESISQMGEYPFSKIMEYVEERKLYYLNRSDNALLEDLKILIWILGELRTEKSIEICKTIYNSGEFSWELENSAMNALRKNGNLARHIFIENLGPVDSPREFRYDLVGTALASYGTSIISDLMEIETENDIEMLARIIDIFNHIINEEFNEKILDFYIGVLSKYDLVIKKSYMYEDDEDIEEDEKYYYEENENVPIIYGKIRSSLIKNRQKSISYLKQQESNIVNDDHKKGIIRAMGLMDDPIFLQSMISFTQDNSFSVREEVMKWYKRLNHRLVLYQNSSRLPEMQSFTGSKSIVDLSLLTER